MPYLFILFIFLPIIEIVVLIQVGQSIGIGYTIGLVLLSAFIGVNMLRYQSLSTIFRAREKMKNGEMPAQEMGEGIVLAIGGALLVTPGFVTDFIGFCCLLPYTRQHIIHYVKNHSNFQFSAKVDGFQPNPNDNQQYSNPGFGQKSHTAFDQNDVIEGEYKDKDK